MQPEFLDRLNASVQDFVRDVEEGAGVAIQVIPTTRLDTGGPFGHGNLEVVVRARQVLLHVPTNGYFPDGAVRHEALHVKRCHIDGVPQLVLADAVAWDHGVANMLSLLDNAIEHVVIVPQELQFHPERRDHWEAVMQRVCDDLPQIPPVELCLAVCMHWAFLRHVLAGSKQAQIMSVFASEHGLLDIANNFADRLLSVADSKEEMVRLLFDEFPQIGRGRAGLDYINSVTGTCHRPIP